MGEPKQITDGELIAIRESLCFMQDEIDAIKDSRNIDFVFTTGVEDSLIEALEIVEALLIRRIDE